jgi:hypothetical protein
MQKVFTISTLFLCVVSARAGIIGGPVLNPNNGHSYYLLSNDTWTNSEAAAVQLGAHLVTVTDGPENQWLGSTFSHFDGTDRSLWIGFSDRATEGNWQWSSGEPVTYTNWWPGEPNDLNGEDYAYLSLDGTWNDGMNGRWAGGADLYGVVEVVPEPVTVILFTLGGGALLRRKML